jgi:hypothetical protein
LRQCPWVGLELQSSYLCLPSNWDYRCEHNKYCYCTFKHSIFTAGIHQEIPLNTDFGIKNEGQDCKIGTLWGVLVEGGR